MNPRVIERSILGKNGKKAIVVVGGAGAMGRITVRDLVETAPDDVEVVIADFNEPAARKLARSFGRQRKVSAVAVDVKNVQETATALRGAFGVVAAVQHQYNLPVMETALAIGAHYCDLGGLFHFTRKQLLMNGRFQKAGLTALLGIGAAPGVVNIMARAAADRMDEVHEIHILVGNVDLVTDRPKTALGTSYSLATILDEASLPAAVFTDGKFKFVEAMSGIREVHFPAPVGLKRPACTIHSEVATLPLSFKNKGIREVSFRIAFAEELDEKLRFLAALGLASEKPIQVGKNQVIPRELLFALLRRIPAVDYAGAPNEYEVLRVEVRGSVGGRPVAEVLDCHVPGIPAWGIGVDVDTGCPPSIAMQMLARGEITLRGAVPPERAVPVAPFFAELAKRGMRIERRTAARIA